jgi:Fe-S-cluster containining protein
LFFLNSTRKEGSMSGCFHPVIKDFYGLFEAIKFSECVECSKCCYFPWLLKEEYDPHLENFGKTVTEINSVAFILDFTACIYAKENRCHLYEDRPLDCRLFPLDIIEDEGTYWWCIFTVCPKHEIIRDKLIPLIPGLEARITEKIFDQYRQQIKITKDLYPPYRLKQYEKIVPLNIQN